MAVVVTGRQGQEQQRLLVAAQERDVAERRADFELGLLLQVADLTRLAFTLGTVFVPTGDERAPRLSALLLALPPDLLPTVRALAASRSDESAKAPLERLSGEQYAKRLQEQVDEELRAAIVERQQPPTPAVSERLAGRRWWQLRTWRGRASSQVKPSLPAGPAR